MSQGKGGEAGHREDHDPGRRPGDGTASFVAGVAPSREPASDAREDEERREHDDEGVQRVAQDHREAADERDLHHEEREPEGEEAGEGRPAPRSRRPAARPSSHEEEGEQDEGRARDRRLDEGGGEGEVADREEADPALAAQGEDLGRVRPPEEAPEVGPVVGGGPDVELVAADELFPLRAEEAHRRLAEPGTLHHVVAVGLASLHARYVDEVEGPGAGEGADGRDLPPGERRTARDEGVRVPAPDPREVLRGRLDPFRREGFEQGREEPRPAPRRKLAPAGDRDEPPGGEPREHGPHRLHGEEPFRLQGVEAGRARPERIHLDEVVLRAARRFDERARVADVEATAGVTGRAATRTLRTGPARGRRRPAEARPRPPRSRRPRAPGAPERPARPEHEHAGAFKEVVGKGGGEVVEIGGRRRPRGRRGIAIGPSPSTKRATCSGTGARARRLSPAPTGAAPPRSRPRSRGRVGRTGSRRASPRSPEGPGGAA